MEITAEQLGRATAVATLVLNDDPNIFSPLVPLARLGARRMNAEVFATLRAMGWLTSALAELAGQLSEQSSAAVLQQVAARLQVELLDP